MTPRSSCAAALPPAAGLGLKPEHFAAIQAAPLPLGFFEIHAENYMVAGGPFHHHLTRIRRDYALSVHGVGLSIGAESGLDGEHLERLAQLIARYEPEAVSEHLAWSSHGGAYLNDLLPLPYTDATLERVCRHIDQVQTRLKRRMLLENPATYLEFADSTWDEPDFIREVLRRTGCGLLLDVNNLHISATNHHRDPLTWLHRLPLTEVGQIHLAGYAEDFGEDGVRLLIDTHAAPVAAEVWALYDAALVLTGPCPTLIERDGDIPEFEVLLAEAECASARLANHGLREAA